MENSRIKITEFLQWNDKNGCYTDKNCDLEEIQRMIYEDTVKYFFGVMNDDFYYGITDNIFELSYDEVINTISDIIEVLDENYGAERNIETDLGRYVVIVENIVDVEMLKKDKLKGIVAEYTDVIKCSEGVNWTSSLFLYIEYH